MDFKEEVTKKSKSTSRILFQLDNIAQNGITNEKYMSFSSKNIALDMYKNIEADDIYVSSLEFADQQNINISRKGAGERDKNVYIPKSVFKSNPGSAIIYSYSFGNPSLFVANKTNKKAHTKQERNRNAKRPLENSIISVSIHNHTIKNLKEPIEFSIKVLGNVSRAKCVYWDENEGTRL